ncbi:MAG: cysteine dioxygenase family protein [Pirellulaceae bacterium]|nr:cysteine dioxygenase family protein [Pirellulaceae bacterium]
MSTVAIPESLVPLVDFLDRLEGRVPMLGLEEQLVKLDVDMRDLLPFMQFGDTTYSRNLICENTWYELLCICWRGGQKSLIHNHAQSTCGLRILTGQGVETTFEERADGLVDPVEYRVLDVGQVCCTQDDDVHQVANEHPLGDDLITLHIYSPPLGNMQTWESSDG